MKTFKHFIITQFNVSFDLSQTDSPDAKGISEDYLENRFILFKKYCLPQIKAQTCKNFLWIVLFSEHTPEKYKKMIDEIHSEFPLFIPRYVPVHDFDGTRTPYPEWLKKWVDDYYTRMKARFPDYEPDEYEECQRYVLPLYLDSVFKEYVDDDTELLVTTRIDNDDEFSKYFVEDLQSRLSDFDEDTIVNYQYGYQYDLRLNVRQLYFYPHNHFTTLISAYKKDGGNETPYNWEHGRIWLYKKVTTVVTKPMWVEYVHVTNVVNHMRYTWKSKLIRKTEYYSDFSDEFPEKTPVVSYLKLRLSPYYNYEILKSFFDTIKTKILNK